MTTKTQDCTACENLRTHPAPSQPFHQFQCAASGLCVGSRVMGCPSFRVRKTGEAPPAADVSAFVWRPAPSAFPAQLDLFGG